METNVKFEDIRIKLKEKAKKVHIATNVSKATFKKCKKIAVREGCVHASSGEANLSKWIEKFMEEAK